MRIAMHRWLPVIGVLAGCAVVAGTAGHDQSIARDPSAAAPLRVVVPLETPHEQTGLVVPHATSERQPQSRKTPPKPIKLDTLDPWTGEDLAPQLELAATLRPRLELDRTDAWDPSIQYESHPHLDDSPLDRRDPWQATASAERAPVPVAVNRRARALDDEDPWAAAPAFGRD